MTAARGCRCTGMLFGLLAAALASGAAGADRFGEAREQR